MQPCCSDILAVVFFVGYYLAFGSVYGAILNVICFACFLLLLHCCHSRHVG
jgi:hypothetical protein